MQQTKELDRTGLRMRGLRVVLYLFVGLVLLDRLVAAHARLWRSYAPRYYRERVEACRGGTWDLLLVGGSPTMGDVNADILAGVRCDGQPLEHVFNLGLPLATASEVYHAVQHGVRTPPKLLVYGITASDLNEDRVEPQGVCELMTLRETARWARERPEAATWCVRQVLQERLARAWKLYYYREGIRLWLADCLERRWPGICPGEAKEAHDGLGNCEALHTSRGLIPQQPVPPSLCLAHAKAEGGRLGDFLYLDHYRIAGYLRHLNRLLDWAERSHVRIVLVDMPVPADLESGAYAPAFATYRATLAQVARDRRVELLRPTREEIGLTDADFADWIHLNADGNIRFSAWLRRALDEKDESLARK
jgi:hypothetical protein